MALTKREGFGRETVAIQDVNVTNTVDIAEPVTVETDYPSSPSQTQRQALTRGILTVELLNHLLLEAKRTNFLLEQIAGIEVPAEVFEDERHT